MLKIILFSRDELSTEVKSEAEDAVYANRTRKSRTKKVGSAGPNDVKSQLNMPLSVTYYTVLSMLLRLVGLPTAASSLAA